MQQSLFQGTLQVCFFSLPLFTPHSFPTPLVPRTPDYLLRSPSPRFRSWLLSLLDSAGLLFSKTISPFLYGLSLFLPSSSFRLVRSISGLKTINLLPLSQSRTGNFLHFSSYFRPPPCYQPAFASSAKRGWDDSTLFGSGDTYCRGHFR